MKSIGQRYKRIEDRPLLQGHGTYADDYTFPDMLHMRVIRSTVAHGTITQIDTAKVVETPGVIDIWTGQDVADIPPIDFRLMPKPGFLPYRQPILAVDRVRYVGEPIAVVFADDSYLAEDCADQVTVGIEPLPPVLDAAGPLGEFAAGLDTEPERVTKSQGDIETAFAKAHRIIEAELIVGRHSGVPMETRGAVGLFNTDLDRIEMYGASKVPHYNRDAIADMLGLARDKVQLFEGHVGGGFGVRGELYPEDVLVCLAAMRLKRPVKWIEDRREHLISTNHARDQVHRVRAAVDETGFILGLENEFFTSQGAYVRTHGATVSDLAAAMLPGPYLVPSYKALGHIRLTNKTPAGTYRAPGRYETTFARERMMDIIAKEMGIGRLEIRRRNLIPPEQMPYVRFSEALETPLIYDSGDYPKLLDHLLTHIDYDDLKTEIETRRINGEMAGFGFGFFVEKSGLGPWDDVRVEIDGDGSIEVVTGVASVGQGVETAIAQICSEVLGTQYDLITVTHGQTDRIERGNGAFASRVTVVTGAATFDAAGKIKSKLAETAAELLQAKAEDLEFTGGHVALAGSKTGASVSLGEVVTAHLKKSGDDAKTVTAEATFETEHMTYPYGIHFAIVCVDPDTAMVKVERYVVAYDVGRAVNPMLIEGQIAGGVAQGVGGALFEEFVYDDQGQPLSTNFADYLIPTASEIPPIETIITEDAPSGTNDLGLKGAGEGGMNAAGAAIASAIDNAIGQPGAIRQLPVTPVRLHKILQARKSS